MSIGTRDEPEKDLDSKFKPKSFQRISRKILKRWDNKKFRLECKQDITAHYRRIKKGWEW